VGYAIVARRRAAKMGQNLRWYRTWRIIYHLSDDCQGKAVQGTPDLLLDCGDAVLRVLQGHRARAGYLTR
jgi:hypothetical protein